MLSMISGEKKSVRLASNSSRNDSSAGCGLRAANNKKSQLLLHLPSAKRMISTFSQDKESPPPRIASGGGKGRAKI
jgi:hypothetical protein